jgi:hypothetical protein
MFAIFLVFTFCVKTRDRLQLKKANNRSIKLASAPVDGDGCYEAYQALVERFKDVTPTPVPPPPSPRKDLVLDQKDVKIQSAKTVTELVDDFKAKCAATAAVQTCLTNLNLIVADTSAVASDQIAFKTLCKVDPPTDDSGDNGLFSLKASRLLIMFGFAIASILFRV